MSRLVGEPSSADWNNVPFMLLWAATMAAAFVVLRRMSGQTNRWAWLGAAALIFPALGGLLFEGFSIIAFVWGGIISAAGVCIAMARSYVVALVQQANCQSAQRPVLASLALVQDALHFVAAKTVQGLFGIAAIGGVCASILFRGGWDDIGTKLNAAWMAVGFGLLCLLCLAWALVPIVRGLSHLHAAPATRVIPPHDDE